MTEGLVAKSMFPKLAGYREVCAIEKEKREKACQGAGHHERRRKAEERWEKKRDTVR